ncbi:MAG: MarR family transcriptional regulator [Alphaproteobacteria bacterium]|nr:MarR family transcriptional regulator [Alphaproteobacteria bacterium]
MIEAYSEILGLVERLHRHFLDVLRVELRNIGVDDINAVQALLLVNIGSEEVVIRDLKDRGYYHGSNVSYNIKKLTQAGYIVQEKSVQDKRAICLRLTEKGLKLCESMSELQQYIAEQIDTAPDSKVKFRNASETLECLERTFTNYVRYGRK